MISAKPVGQQRVQGCSAHIPMNVAQPHGNILGKFTENLAASATWCANILRADGDGHYSPDTGRGGCEKRRSFGTDPQAKDSILDINTGKYLAILAQ
jgi:hypothetical protein